MNRARAFGSLWLAASALLAAGCSSANSATADAGAGPDAAMNPTPTDGSADGDGPSSTSPGEGGDDGGDEATTDGDATSAMGDGGLAFAASNVPPGTTLAAPGDWVFSSAQCGGSTSVTIDTSKGISDCDGQTPPYQYSVITQSDTSLGSLQAALFVTNKFTIEAGMSVKVVGNLPLIVVALSDVSINGLLDATVDTIYGDHAYAGGASGPAMSTRGNGPGGGTAPTAMSGAGGGGFCGKGGDGAAATGTGAAGGIAYGNPTNVPLLGGSSGASGGYEKGGGSGGAIQIASATSIQVTALGVIDVGGGGGGWIQSGGGSGGAILLQAPTVTVAGTLAANGGGGAESGDNNNGQNAQPSATAAAGGVASSGRNAGGNGAAGTAVDGAAGPIVAMSANGGGGGGGAGRIRIDTSTGSATVGSTAVLSPALSTPCATQGMLSK
jgi:hypothetical protein